jgi:hypothetical protein
MRDNDVQGGEKGALCVSTTAGAVGESEAALAAREAQFKTSTGVGVVRRVPKRRASLPVVGSAE